LSVGQGGHEVVPSGVVAGARTHHLSDDVVDFAGEGGHADIDAVVARQRIQLGNHALDQSGHLFGSFAGHLDLAQFFEADLAVGTNALALHVDRRDVRAMNLYLIRRFEDVVLRRHVNLIGLDEGADVIGIRREASRDRADGKQERNEPKCFQGIHSDSPLFQDYGTLLQCPGTLPQSDRETGRESL